MVRVNSVLLVLLLFMSSGVVTALEVELELDSDVIVREYSNTLTLQANLINASSGTYNLYTFADLLLLPSETFTLEQGNVTKLFTLTPTESLDVEGYYVFTTTLNHRGVEKIDTKLTVQLVNLEDILEVGSDAVDPDASVIEFYVQNTEDVRLENVTATFSSVLFNHRETFTLEPHIKKVFQVRLDPEETKKIKTGVYIIETVFETDAEDVKIEGNLYLGEKKDISTLEDSSGLFIKTDSVTKINTGNTLESVQITIQKNIFSRLFTTFSIEPRIVERDGFRVEYTWIKDRLDPSETYTVKATTNYMFPILIILFGIFVIFTAKRFIDTKLEIRKSVSHVRTKNGEFALKITIRLKARKNLENVTVIDKIPPAVKIYKKFGTLKPDKIDPQTRRVTWNIGNLDSGEERVFTYLVYSRVGIVGKFSLPEALGVFEREGAIHEVASNQVFFLSDQIRGED